MKHESLLNTTIFRQIESGEMKNPQKHYECFRTEIVDFCHAGHGWQTIHTGLTLLIAELHNFVEEGIEGEALKYAKRLMSIASRMLVQVELVANCGNTSMTRASTGDEKEVMKPEATPVLSAQYTDVCEIINLIITMNMLNGGKISNKEIISRVHWLFGLKYSADKYYKTRGEIIRRCPKDDNRAYFLTSAVKTLNNEYANA